MSISPDAIVVAAGAQVSTALGSETVILHFNKGSYFGLNDVGTVIWGKLQQPCPIRDLFDTVLREFDVDEETCRRDVLKLVENLRAEGLIEVRDAPAA